MNIISERLNLVAFLLPFALIALISCNKGGALQTTSGALVYNSGYDDFHEIKPVDNRARLTLDNAHPYLDIMGSIIANTNFTSSDGKPVKYNDLEITDVVVFAAVVNIVTQDAFISDHLTNSEIIFEYYDASNTLQKKTIASSTGYSSGKINYSFSAESLIDVFRQDKYGQLYIDFDFDSNDVDHNIGMYYDLSFSYNYTYLLYIK